MSHLPAILIFLLSAIFLSGCNTAAIYNDDRYNPPVYWGSHVVKSGETLYGIAWRYGRDYRELGDANGLKPPWEIRAGQVLRLDRKGRIRHADNSSAQAKRKPVAKPPASRTSSNKAAPVKSVSKAPPVRRSGSPGSQTVANIKWRWPHAGTVIASYSTSGKVNKGIDIVGRPGDAVRAAADGSVVYAGDGLLGYGNLIIVNHNEHYLSAYAHNRKILVQEGEGVKAGQVIAELGSSGTDKPMLHFEIRKNGNPVDPSRYLPRR
ncbi:peptidoglycan DD-metalloendopeptidase family protein [Marinobacter sp. MDS2]|uniref:peptidoglycan DD-metalloendopeptidase family protein n=1 Tax=Marinobacter sp. MDS2 TaxID=3065961 RepID=UPI00273CC918|nr:peptidoglycan DD-metalloendopeptidase family protein [Marinobacter sp. MDS2]MDP4548769.1 peptidoglycan DD-metalloendopeptidase family protein [Marinobacter sp. MDS2]